MTRTEQLLHDGAEHHWPGSGDDLVIVYRAANDREQRLYFAATISALLRNQDQRSKCLESLARRLPTVSRSGPKRDRIEAARKALERLEQKVEMPCS